MMAESVNNKICSIYAN